MKKVRNKTNAIKLDILKITMPGRGRPKAGKPDLSEDYDRDREGILANFLLKINNNEDIDTNQIFKVLILQMLRLEKEFKRMDSLECKLNDLAKYDVKRIKR